MVILLYKKLNEYIKITLKVLKETFIIQQKVLISDEQKRIDERNPRN